MNKKIFNGTALSIMAFYTSNLNASLYGRDLARKLKANQRTVQLSLNILEKEKIIKSKRNGKNKEFLLNRENPLTKQILIMAEIFKSYTTLSSNFELHQIISDVIKHTNGVVLIYGSFIKGYATKESDLDILIIGRMDITEEETLKSKYSREIHTMFLNEREFVDGLKKKANFILEVAENHLICQGFEKFINWRCGYD